MDQLYNYQNKNKGFIFNFLIVINGMMANLNTITVGIKLKGQIQKSTDLRMAKFKSTLMVRKVMTMKVQNE